MGPIIIKEKVVETKQPLILFQETTMKGIDEQKSVVIQVNGDNLQETYETFLKVMEQVNEG